MSKAFWQMKSRDATIDVYGIIFSTMGVSDLWDNGSKDICRNLDYQIVLFLDWKMLNKIPNLLPYFQYIHSH